MTAKEIAEEAASNVKMLTDPITEKEWIESLAFRIEQHKLENTNHKPNQ